MLAVIVGQVTQKATTGPESGGIEGRQVLIGALLAVAHHEFVDQAGVRVLQLLIGKTQALQGSITGVGQEHICFFQQLVQRFHALFGLQIQRDMVLSGVVQVIDGVVILIVDIRHIHTDSLTPHIATGSFDLNDLCAQISEQSATNGRCHKGGQFYNADTFQRLSHNDFLLNFPGANNRDGYTSDSRRRSVISISWYPPDRTGKPGHYSGRHEQSANEPGCHRCG